MSDFQPLDVVYRGSETQLRVGENLKYIFSVFQCCVYFCGELLIKTSVKISYNFVKKIVFHPWPAGAVYISLRASLKPNKKPVKFIIFFGRC